MHVYFGGPLELMTAEMLVLLFNDLFLVFLSVVGIGCYMRFYFGQWRLAGFASLQILLSFPLMYFVVCVLFLQFTLSAFAAASLAIVVGVSADNIFVLHETWGQSRMLRRRGQPASEEERIEWTVRQAGVPLFFANATTAASLFINCISPIDSIFQFGLCGGVLIFLNFGLVGVYLPAVLILEERGRLSPGAPPPDMRVREKTRRERLLFLQSVHRWLWDRRSAVLAGFALLVVFMTPFALSLSPGNDASFTFAPDPIMTDVIARARLPPTDPAHLFRTPEGVNTTRVTTFTPADGGPDTIAPIRFGQMMLGSFEPTPSSGTAWFGSVLSVLCLYDAVLLFGLTIALYSDRVVGFFQAPPDGDLPPVAVASIAMLASFSLTFGLCLGYLALFLCDFSREAWVPLGELLGLLLLGHSAFFAKVRDASCRRSPAQIRSAADLRRSSPLSSA